MKQSLPKKAPAPPASARFLSASAHKKLSFYVLLLAVIAPLLDALVIFPLRQIILANSSGTSMVYEVFYQITELFNLTAFFLLLTLTIYCALADAPKLLGRIVALHGIASVFIVILLRMGIYYLLAWIDAEFYPPFDLCNQTLNSLTKNDGAEWMALSLTLFLSQVILFVLLGIIALLSLRARQTAIARKIDLSPAALSEQWEATPFPRLIKLTLILYALQAFANQIIDTVLSLLDLGVPNAFSTLLSLIVPYFLLALYCLLGYLAMDAGARYIARQVKNCASTTEP